jgi:hypothetical protein
VFKVSAVGGYRYLFTNEGPSWYAKAEQTLEWAATGSAQLGRGATDADFRISGAVLDGALTSYELENSSSSTTVGPDGTPVTCTRSYVELPFGSHIKVHPGLSGTKPSNLAVGLGDGSFNTTAAESGSGPPSCAPPVTRTWQQVFRYQGLKYSFHPIVTSDGESTCSNSGSLATGLTRSCTGIVRHSPTRTETWTMNVTLSPDS